MPTAGGYQGTDTQGGEMSNAPIPEDLKEKYALMREWLEARKHISLDPSWITYLIERIAAVEAERDEFERKGKDLCQAYGNSLVTIHDLKADLAQARETIKRLVKAVGDLGQRVPDKSNNYF